MNGLTLDAFRSGKFSKATSAFTAFMFTFVFYLSPNSKAVADELSKDDARQAKLERILENTPEKKLAHRLEKLKRKLVKELPNKVAQRNSQKDWMSEALDAVGFGDMPLRSGEVEELATLKQDIALAYDQAIAAFEEEGKQLSARGKLRQDVKDLVRQRHAEAIETVKRQYAELTTTLDQLLTTQDADEQHKLLETLSDRLKKQQFQRNHTVEDPNQLPWRAPSDNVREPKTNKRNLQAALGIDPYSEYVQFASSDVTADMLAAAALAEEKGVTDADLAETIDIQITDEIEALAAGLNNNPVEIYTWVHNHIRFVPSYGSIQGAQYTLETKRGNAIDTASLLIALLRAAGIPAKYAYGTVEMPVDQVMNWVGGVTAPEAAQSLLGQGGIPNTALIEGGKITKIRMEHTWVEAFVDFEPSRGMKNRAGDNWIPMDASFKQYEFSEGMSLREKVPFDEQALSQAIEQSALINEDEGWVKNIPQKDLEIQLTQFQNQVDDYIAGQSADATVKEVLGLQSIDVLPARPLSAGLPYSFIVVQDSFSKLPDNLRHKFKYELATQSYGYPNAPFISLNEPTAKLAGKRLALSFRPASAEDQEIIESYLPEPDPTTGEINLEDFPETLPGYLINLVAELRVDGHVIQSAPASTMGTELHETLGLFSPSHQWFTSNNNPVAGGHRAIGLDLQGISPEQLANIEQNIEKTKAILDSGDAVMMANLTNDELVGDIIFGTILSYFALGDVQEAIQAQSSDMVTYRLPSYGIFGPTVQPSYWFGVPRNISFSGLTMDVDLITFHGAAKDNSETTEFNFKKAVGSHWSAMEHLVPEQMFSQPGAPAHGMSAVKALAIASAEGQKIWQITRDNLELALASVNLGTEVETEIKNSVLAGNVATVHEANISYFDWVGSGYLLIDPESGAGAYKIAGGANGGFILTFVAGVIGALDGLTRPGAQNGKPDWDGAYKKIWQGAQWAKVLGGVALIAEIGLTLTDGSLSWTDKLGRIFGALFAFAATSIVVGAAFAFAGVVFAAIVGLIFAVLISYLMSRFYEIYFSSALGNRSTTRVA